MKNWADYVLIFTAIVGESGHVFLTFYANIICKLDKPSEICCPAAR